MATGKTFLTILCLLLYSCLSTAEIDVSQVNKVEKGMTMTKEFLQSLSEVFKKEGKDTARDPPTKVLKVFGSLGKVAASFGFIRSSISFIFASIPQSDPTLEFMKEQFAEVNRKLNSLSLQISTLQTGMKWTNYASSYGKDENVIKNSWAKLTEFIQTAPFASTQEQKTRLAKSFTTFYENTGTDKSVANLYRYITENNNASLNKNLLKLIIKKSNGNFNVLVQYSTYFTTLMVSGLKLNVFYHKLKGYDDEVKVQEAVKQLSNTLSAIQDALIECAGDFEKWAHKDAVKLSSQRFSSREKLASDIKHHLESKFHWFKWIVIAHPKDARNEFTFGQSINIYVREKTSVHIIHQEKGFTVDQNIKHKVTSSLQKGLLKLINTQKCGTMKDKLLDKLITSHIQFLHAVTKPSDYAQTDVPDIKLSFQLAGYPKNTSRDFNVFLKGNTVVKTPCSDVNCNHGECKPIKDTTQVFCKCYKMFHGPACEESIQNIINYAALEGEINGVIYKPVPDLTKIYFSVQELKKYTQEIVESVRHDVQWTQTFVKYSNVIQKFRFISTLHSRLKNSTITQRHYISEVGAQFTGGGHSFQFYLTEFHHMMMGTGVGDKHNILDIFRKSLVQDSQKQSGEPVECSKYYTDQIDYFVRYMFALEKEAVLAWSKYLLVTGKAGNTVEKVFKDYVSQQWRLFNKNGCGPLKAVDLQNNHCKELYHSTAQQQVKIKCGGLFKPFPHTVGCSGGQWSALPVCYAEQVNGRVECKSEGRATICKASCSPGWGSATHPLLAQYKCPQQPCPSFTPHKCNNCMQNSVCKAHEVCTGSIGTCRETCLVKPCGVNAKCFSFNHDRSCTCVNPWKGDPYQGCRSQDLQWVHTRGVPSNAVRSITQLAVCKAIGPDSGWHSGFVKNQRCIYEYDWKEYQANSYEVLVDPCGGRGWKWMHGVQWNMVSYDESKRFRGVKYYVCSATRDGLVGKLFNTRHGFLCHIARVSDLYADISNDVLDRIVAEIQKLYQLWLPYDAWPLERKRC